MPMELDEHQSPEFTAILLVEDDDEVRENLINLLEGRGYRVVVATNEDASVAAVLASPQQIGLILVDQMMSSDQALALGRRIRSYFSMAATVPVVVIPMEFTEEKEGSDESVGGRDYKAYLANYSQLENLLARLLGLFDIHGVCLVAPS